ncbi:hypothetical protein Fmac_026879 [Flemingia macrophylla]|uniref:Uncharacterized protein n=1 Tax=Flemingia macrophylla TaxID=520843 RepID=A0ABD1LG40_9FABA
MLTVARGPHWGHHREGVQGGFGIRNYENLRLIKSFLPETVEACVDVSGHEFDVSCQKTLLRQFQRDRIQEMCKILRVLNAVHSPEIGIRLSIQQYKVLRLVYLGAEIVCIGCTELASCQQLLTPFVLIGLLINAHQHLLALRISEYLGMNQVWTEEVKASQMGNGVNGDN